VAVSVMVMSSRRVVARRSRRSAVAILYGNVQYVSTRVDVNVS